MFSFGEHAREFLPVELFFAWMDAFLARLRLAKTRGDQRYILLRLVRAIAGSNCRCLVREGETCRVAAGFFSECVQDPLCERSMLSPPCGGGRVGVYRSPIPELLAAIAHQPAAKHVRSAYHG